MKSPSPTVSVDDVHAIAAKAFVPTGHGRIGVEIEWLVFDVEDNHRPVSVDEVRLAVGSLPLPAGGAVSFEPGGQLELSTECFAGPDALLAAVGADAGELVRRVAGAGLQLVALGIDPVRDPQRTLRLPRYDAMEAAFDVDGPAGRAMMCSTASLQVNVDFGHDPFKSWKHVARFGPVLGAVFANSPRRRGCPSGFASARQRVWSEIDRSRAGPVPTDDPRRWGEYALDARVLMIRTASGASPVRNGMSLRSWVEKGHELGFPSADDVAYHLTTLFPPVRPRGWLELRMIDALACDARRVALAVSWALVTCPEAGEQAARTCRDLIDPWTAMMFGLGDNAMREAAKRTLAIAGEALDDTSPILAAEVRSWNDTMVRHGRTPGDAPEEGSGSWRRACVER